MSEELGPWCNGAAWCLECRHEWVAVWPLGAESLECPACGSTDTRKSIGAIAIGGVSRSSAPAVSAQPVSSPFS